MKPFDAAAYLDDTSRAELLAEALQTGDAEIITATLSLIARSMSEGFGGH